MGGQESMTRCATAASEVALFLLSAWKIDYWQAQVGVQSSGASTQNQHCAGGQSIPCWLRGVAEGPEVWAESTVREDKREVRAQGVVALACRLVGGCVGLLPVIGDLY